MQRPAELDLALYVDHLAAAEPDTGSYAAGITESESAERDDRKPVHLADLQRPAELDLALYVDHLAAAEPDTGSYAAGITESESAERDDRKPVHLADLFAVRLDTDRLARDFLLQAAIDTVAAAELGIDRPLHLGRSDDLFAGPNRNLVGLLQQIDDPAQAGRQPLGIA